MSDMLVAILLDAVDSKQTASNSPIPKSYRAGF
jgi:hypothetical protein